MRRITNKERLKSGNIYCSFCRPKKVLAEFRVKGFATYDEGFACKQHKYLLSDSDNTHYTEADYQTWNK